MAAKKNSEWEVIINYTRYSKSFTELPAAKRVKGKVLRFSGPPSMDDIIAKIKSLEPLYTVKDVKLKHRYQLS